MHEETFDLTGLKCPLPVLKFARICRTIKHQSTIHLITDDPKAIDDVRHFCAQQGHQLKTQIPLAPDDTPATRPLPATCHTVVIHPT